MKETVKREALDRRLMSGERQVETDVSKIDFWHVWRYKQAADMIKPGETVIDFGCGIGYGSRLMAEKAGSVIGVDDSAETIEFATENFSAENVRFERCSIERLAPVDPLVDVAVAFEVIEHLENPEPFLALVKSITKRLFVLSVPHVSVDLALSPFHYRHYTEPEAAELVTRAGFRVVTCELKQFTKGKAIFCVGDRPC